MARINKEFKATGCVKPVGLFKQVAGKVADIRYKQKNGHDPLVTRKAHIRNVLAPTRQQADEWFKKVSYHHLISKGQLPLIRHPMII